jgi:hypothetical protein
MHLILNCHFASQDEEIMKKLLSLMAVAALTCSAAYADCCDEGKSSDKAKAGCSEKAKAECHKKGKKDKTASKETGKEAVKEDVKEEAAAEKPAG